MKLCNCNMAPIFIFFLALILLPWNVQAATTKIEFSATTCGGYGDLSEYFSDYSDQGMTISGYLLYDAAAVTSELPEEGGVRFEFSAPATLYIDQLGISYDIQYWWTNTFTDDYGVEGVSIQIYAESEGDTPSEISLNVYTYLEDFFGEDINALPVSIDQAFGDGDLDGHFEVYSSNMAYLSFTEFRTCSQVPAPSTVFLLGAALPGLWCIGRRKSVKR